MKSFMLSVNTHSACSYFTRVIYAAANKNVVARISIVTESFPLVVLVISLRDWKNRDGCAHCLLVRSTKPKVDLQGFEKRQTKERGRNSLQSTTPTHLLWTIQQGRGRRYRSVLSTIKMN